MERKKSVNFSTMEMESCLIMLSDISKLYTATHIKDGYSSM